LAWATRISEVAENYYDEGIAAMDDNSVVVNGSFVGRIDFDRHYDYGIRLDSEGDQDMFIARYAP
jgi:hypothetical protein